MIRKLMLILAVSMLTASAQAVEMVTPVYDLSTATVLDGESIFGKGGLFGPEAPTGDTYTGAPLAQTAATALFLVTPAPTTHTFDGTAENGGANLANAGSDFRVTESVTTAGMIETIRVEWTSVNATGAPTPWVAAGVTGPNGTILTSWRLDVAALAGGLNLIDNPGWAFIPGTAVFRAFNSALAPLGTFAQLAAEVPAAGAQSVKGVGIVGLGGADIAGFNMASIQLEWQMEQIPEPTTGLLGAMGLLGLLLRRR